MNARALFWVAVVGALLLGGYGVSQLLIARGVRNNNPGNLRRTGDAWLGLSPQQTDPDYFQFSNAVFGIRALSKVLQSYASYGVRSVRDLVNRYAPAIENPTSEYIAAVADRLQVNPDASLDINSRLVDVMKAIITQEVGQQPYADVLFREALQWRNP